MRPESASSEPVRPTRLLIYRFGKRCERVQQYLPCRRLCKLAVVRRDNGLCGGSHIAEANGFLQDDLLVAYTIRAAIPEQGTIFTSLSLLTIRRAI